MMNMLEHENRIVMQQAEYENRPKVRDEVDLFVPLSSYEDELAMKMSKQVEVEPGKFVVLGHLELKDEKCDDDHQVGGKQKNSTAVAAATGQKLEKELQGKDGISGLPGAPGGIQNNLEGLKQGLKNLLQSYKYGTASPNASQGPPAIAV